MSKPAKSYRLDDHPATKLDIDSLAVSIENLENKVSDRFEKLEDKVDSIITILQRNDDR